jgi:hypothetical protein
MIDVDDGAHGVSSLIVLYENWDSTFNQLASIEEADVLQIRKLWKQGRREYLSRLFCDGFTLIGRKLKSYVLGFGADATGLTLHKDRGFAQLVDNQLHGV